ncbi:hypothetical protein A2U01_0082960 [Trifolium medium]|uniref:Uncharacterized protein n=1 Tax=Trifolium medium TaxID=97028 RepID=A0A392TKN4_9FABA|nr:hypothetical protein [Trifolium medium]
MAAMDMPTAAVWDNRECSTKVADKEIESADKEIETSDIAETENNVCYDYCFYRCHDWYHYFCGC